MALPDEVELVPHAALVSEEIFSTTAWFEKATSRQPGDQRQRAPRVGSVCCKLPSVVVSNGSSKEGG
jgi:hypothetical protein